MSWIRLSHRAGLAGIGCAVLAHVLLPSAAQAFKCVQYFGAQGQFRGHAAVFTGTVVAKDLRDDAVLRSRGYSGEVSKAVVEVEEAWKGVDDSVVSVWSYGPELIEDESYLFYVDRHEVDGERGFKHGPCSATAALSDAGEQLTALRPRPAVQLGQRRRTMRWTAAGMGLLALCIGGMWLGGRRGRAPAEPEDVEEIDPADLPPLER